MNKRIRPLVRKTTRIRMFIIILADSVASRLKVNPLRARTIYETLSVTNSFKHCNWF